MNIQQYIERFMDHATFDAMEVTEEDTKQFFDFLDSQWQHRMVENLPPDLMLEEMDGYGFDWSLVETEEEDMELYGIRMLANALFYGAYFIGRDHIRRHFLEMPSETALAALGAWGPTWCQAVPLQAPNRSPLPALARYLSHRHIQKHLTGMLLADVESDGYPYLTHSHCIEAVRQDLKHFNADEFSTRQILQLAAVECERGPYDTVAWPESSLACH